MYKLMQNAHGIGLAATQVGLNMRLFIMAIANKRKIVAINPQIIKKYGETYQEEGCLSFPGISANIKRAAYIEIVALNEFGKSYRLKAEGNESKCIQHEIDHLNGISFVDHLSRLKKKIISKKYQHYLEKK
jgi:peptide deformylase